jgi:hypothetical protein
MLIKFLGLSLTNTELSRIKVMLPGSLNELRAKTILKAACLSPQH